MFVGFTFQLGSAGAAASPRWYRSLPQARNAAAALLPATVGSAYQASADGGFDVWGCGLHVQVRPAQLDTGTVHGPAPAPAGCYSSCGLCNVCRRAGNSAPAVTIPRNVRGAKWINSAPYITDGTRREILRAVTDCRAMHPGQPVGIRPGSYIGDPSSVAVVDYGAGRRIFRAIYAEPQS